MLASCKRPCKPPFQIICSDTSSILFLENQLNHANMQNKHTCSVHRQEGTSIQEFFAAAESPLANRVIPTFAAKRGSPTMDRYAVRAYLQVLESGDVFVIPWTFEVDFTQDVCGKLTPSGVVSARLGRLCKNSWQILGVPWEPIVETRFHDNCGACQTIAHEDCG